MAERSWNSTVPPVTTPPVIEVFNHLDELIEHASKAQQGSRRDGDERAVHALDDAISLLEHVRSRLQYDLTSDDERDLGPAV